MNNCQNTTDHVDQIQYKFLLNTHLNLIYLNIRSLRKNFSQFLATINKIANKINIVVLVETNVRDNKNNFCKITGFKSLTTNREGRRGGIAIYIKENINYSLITTAAETMQIGITLMAKQFLLFLFIDLRVKT